MPTAIKVQVHRPVSPSPKKRKRSSSMKATLEDSNNTPKRKPDSFPVLDAIAELLSYGCSSGIHDLDEGIEQVATAFRFGLSGQRIHLVIAGSDITDEHVQCLYRIWFLLRTLAQAHPQGRDPEVVLEEQYHRVVREVYTMCYAATFQKLFQKWGKRTLLNSDMKRPSIVGDESTLDKLAKIFVYAERCQNFFLRLDSVDDSREIDDFHWKRFAINMNQLTTLTFEVTSAKSVCELWASLCDYHYDGSPFVAKLEALLLLKNISARRVDVPLYPPRPQLLNLLGVPYRRVPVLALGRDLYVDTSLLVNVLERRFPENTLFPKHKDGGSIGLGIQKTLVQTPKALQEDRIKFLGGRQIDFKKLEDKLEISHSELSSHLEILNEQLSDGREWIFDTVTPGFTDVGIYFVLAWIRTFRKTRPVFDSVQFPHAVAWLDRLENILKSKRSASPSLLSKVSGEEAAKEILSSEFEDLSYVGFDEVDAKRLGLTREMLVAICPDDTGLDVPTSGKLLALNKTHVVIEVVNPDDSSKSVRVHFPRLGYVIQPVSNSDSISLNAKL
ncbi:hypothetical protein Clacol_002462 [Clathrus columnatus]|uniref:Uncharacterized protein n=1 Tax=Clathrus columnatus TaxID=1419009 RepID=A0AAV5A0V4_9AGAM|nr:hypothetical protein Clacol_002462 [Clathrus columnatus]